MKNNVSQQIGKKRYVIKAQTYPHCKHCPEEHKFPHYSPCLPCQPVQTEIMREQYKYGKTLEYPLFQNLELSKLLLAMEELEIVSGHGGFAHWITRSVKPLLQSEIEYEEKEIAKSRL